MKFGLPYFRTSVQLIGFLSSFVDIGLLFAKNALTESSEL